MILKLKNVFEDSVTSVALWGPMRRNEMVPGFLLALGKE
jgi:hypothetical protein